ncbi:PqqD family peptide modification chaperone [Aliiroseovarius sp. KMU-50]|uniref:PqqD family peptide modification chaperone n=1 Tax=Aliiroseovarius salicola TaxID=3009082 RepID=A0ABT4W5A3_9RHOB|nr:PqqD family protein [Aliiroseovarius sp. KMU-50]MDA5095569.1 PqqD family peptide modification chaperone [Aliiroseovarius sp. KMU-50]
MGTGITNSEGIPLTRYVTYAELQAPVAFDDATDLHLMASEIMRQWPMVESDSPSAPPFAHLAPAADKPKKWCLTRSHGEVAPKIWNAVDAICDLISEMAWERLRSDPELLCLHAAAVAFGERLVVFPNARRAGKSTLSTLLARLGLPLFTDDFLPVDVRRPGHEAGASRIEGIANGIAPRLRLPVPENFSSELKDWVHGAPGRANARYKYLTDLPIAPGRSRLPIGAIVVLDRKADPTPPALEVAESGEVMTALIRQNFSRDQHAGRILKAAEAVVRHAPLYRLVYSSAEEAANFLKDHHLLQDLPAPELPSTSAQDQGDGVDNNVKNAPTYHLPDADPFDPVALYSQAPGLSETSLDGAHFLADGSGHAIHQLNPGSQAIWRILSEPASAEDVAEILMIAFPDVDPEQIRQDSVRAMRQFANAHLIRAHIQDAPHPEQEAQPQTGGVVS